MTQAAQLIQAIRKSGKRGMTTLELEKLGISQCPWKRLTESGSRYLREGEMLERVEGKDGLRRYMIQRYRVQLFQAAKIA